MAILPDNQLREIELFDTQSICSIDFFAAAKFNLAKGLPTSRPALDPTIRFVMSSL
jgi:hypothetical protein